MLFLITSTVYALMLLVTIPHVMDFAGGMKLLDMMPKGYSSAYVSSLLTALGDEGRNAYLYRQLPLDFLYPGLFAITYCLIFAYLLRKLDKLDSFLFYFSLLPLLAGLFDYFENIGLILLLTGYPESVMKFSGITNAFSVLKSSLTTVYFIGLIILLVAVVRRYFLSRKSNRMSRKSANRFS